MFPFGIFLVLILVLNSCSSGPISDPVTTSVPKSTPSPSVSPSVSTTTTATKEIPVKTVVSLSLDGQQIKSGDVFLINLLIDTQTALRGFQWSLKFNPQLMRCDKITEGKFFKDWAVDHSGETIIFPKPQADNSAGRVSEMGIAIMTSQKGGASGSGIACTYSFTALADTIEIPQLSDVIVIDSNANLIDALIKSQ
jgi:hypothetical protein